MSGLPYPSTRALTWVPIPGTLSMECEGFSARWRSDGVYDCFTPAGICFSTGPLPAFYYVTLTKAQRQANTRAQPKCKCGACLGLGRTICRSCEFKAELARFDAELRDRKADAALSVLQRLDALELVAHAPVDVIAADTLQTVIDDIRRRLDALENQGETRDR